MDGAETAAEHLPAVPGYRILSALGAGGFGSVYHAVQENVDREVALKVGHANLHDPEVQRRFRAESRAIGRLSWHPHVVPLYDVGVTPGSQPFMAMEYLPNGSLAAGSGSRPVPLVVRHALQVADALAEAHQAGILHRDLKPDNVLVTRRGDAKLADFGIAAIADASRATATGTFVGSIAYSAPELFAGQRADVVTEVYGLAALVYALLAGATPHRSTPEDTPISLMWRISQQDPEPLDRSVPLALRELVGRGLAKDRGERPQDMAAMIDLLRRLEVGGSVVAVAGPDAVPTVVAPPTSLVATEPIAPPVVPGPPPADPAARERPRRPGPAVVGPGGTTLSDFTATDIRGEPVALSAFAGKVVLVVNTASHCGFTPQYDGLEDLYRTFGTDGLVVLGFPCDQFGHQEPGDEAEIERFCTTNHGVTFPLFAKVEVNGDGAHPLFAWLRSEKGGALGSKIKWNFTKFLIGRDGRPIRRYSSTTKPEKLVSDIRAALRA